MKWAKRVRGCCLNSSETEPMSRSPFTSKANSSFASPAAGGRARSVSRNIIVRRHHHSCAGVDGLEILRTIKLSDLFPTSAEKRAHDSRLKGWMTTKEVIRRRRAPNLKKT